MSVEFIGNSFGIEGFKRSVSSSVTENSVGITKIYKCANNAHMKYVSDLNH
jgi:hypothetical protein